MKNRKVGLSALAGALLSGVAGVSQAAISVTPITDAATDVTTIGAAVFGVVVLIAAYKWVRRAL